jgi:NAD(P)-dependent dehydrogenase (short-subunit alcohol dehydrogenase family)
MRLKSEREDAVENVNTGPRITPGDPAHLFDLTGRKALVTGGSRGLGRQIALGFARAGGDVVIASRKLEACEQVAREIEALGRRALPVACHVGHWEELPGLVDRAYAAFGRLDILVNNAGMSPLFESLDTLDEALVDKVLEVNYKGPLRLMSLVAPRMAADGGGAIINVSSVGALRPDAWIAPYASAKAALNAATVAFARGYGAQGVRVNTLSPGGFLTDVSTAWRDDAGMRDSLVLRRFGEPEEIVSSALYLATAPYTTGANLVVDGGGR